MPRYTHYHHLIHMVYVILVDILMIHFCRFCFVKKLVYVFRWYNFHSNGRMTNHSTLLFSFVQWSSQWTSSVHYLHYKIVKSWFLSVSSCCIRIVRYCYQFLPCDTSTGKKINHFDKNFRAMLGNMKSDLKIWKWKWGIGLASELFLQS